jgi:hypothetical protein
MEDELAGFADQGLLHCDAEIFFLQRYWDDLDHEERESSISNARNFLDINNIERCDLSVQKRRDLLEDIVNSLDVLNKRSRPSIFISFRSAIKGREPMPNYSICMRYVADMTEDNLVELGKYLIIKDAESLRDRRDELIAGIKRSTGYGMPLARFYALRHYLKDHF